MGTTVIVCLILVVYQGGFAEALDKSSSVRSPDLCRPTVVAHRGASGYVPEHTIGAYALAVSMGADYIEPDLVMTKDGHLIARHENELSLTTDVASREEFASRYRTQTIYGVEVSGWWSEDFTLTEIKTLRATELFETIRAPNARMNGAFTVPTMQEIIHLAQAMQKSEKRVIGIYPEIKYGTHFQNIGLAMEKPLVDLLHINGYVGSEAPVYIQSFEVNNLKELRNMTDIRLLQLIGNIGSQPFDQALLGTNLTYATMATAEGLREVATYAAGVGPNKVHIIPRDENNNLGTPTSFMSYAHAAGLQVHPYTFRAENAYLPDELRSAGGDGDFGDMRGELQAFIDAGVDGFFVDHPDILVQMRGTCLPFSRL